jgi:hypothetical protein
MPLMLAAACGDSSDASKDSAVADQGIADQSTADQGAAPDLGVAPDSSQDAASPPDLQPADAPPVASDVTNATWPPPTPYHKGKLCALPPCDPKAAETADLSGTWTQKITTKSQTCNPLARAMKKELQPGNVQTLTGQTILRAGECVYKGKIGGTVVGVIKGNVMITCEVLTVTAGVTPIAEGQVTFSGNTGSGPAWTYLFDVPLPPSSCQASCTIDMKRE